MINVDAIRRLLVVADVERDPYAVAEVAAALLAANATDAAALGHYVRALGTLKLFAAAQRALGNAPNPSGIVPWPSRARRFAANLRALSTRDPAGAELVQAAASQLPAFELHQCADGNFQVHDASQPAWAGWLGGLADHKAAQALWHFDRAATPIPTPLLFEGLGFGWLFLHTLRTTQNTYLDYTCAAYVLAGDPLALAMLFHMHDLQECIAQPRTRWFVRESGEVSLAAFRAAVSDEKSWTLPQQFIRCALRPLPPLPLEETVKVLAADRQRASDAITRQIAAFYENKDAAYWAGRFDDALAGRGEKLRVLGITSRYTTVLRHSMAELQAAVNAHPSGACAMRIAIEPDDQSLENPFAEMIAEYQPDLIVQISRLRHENPRIPRDVPFLCWDQDNLPCMRDPQTRADLNPTTFIAGFGAGYGSVSLNWPLKNCIFCYPTGMTHACAPEPLSAADCSAHESDVSYVSHASGSPESLRDSLAGRWNGANPAAAVFHAAAECILAEAREAKGAGRSSVGFGELIRQQAAALNVTLPAGAEQELVANLTSIADRAYRHHTLAWAARWCEDRGKKFRIWGHGWEKHPTLSRFAAGPALPGRGAQAVYAASKINLQIIETGALHSRLLDGWASGGFFLMRQALLPEEQAAAETHWRIAQLTLSENIATIADLETRGSPELQRQWQLVGPLYHDRDRVAPFAGFKIWQSLPPPHVLIPGLQRLMFNDEIQFRELADRYIASEEIRRQSLAEIRPILLRHFSYDARWRDFLAHIRQNLQGVS